MLTSAQEGTDHVDFSEDEPETIQMMLEYLYSGRYFSDSGCGCEADVEMIDDQASQIVRETGSETPAVSRPTKDSEAKHVLLANLKVYTLADRLGLARLKQHARDLFFTSAEPCLSEPLFAEVLREVFERAPYDDDINLRRQVVVRCFNYFGKVIDNAPVLQVLKAEEPLALEYAQESYKRVLELTSTKARLADSIVDAEAASSFVKAVRLEAVYGEARRYFRKTRRCSSCNGWIYEGGQWPEIHRETGSTYAPAAEKGRYYVNCRSKGCNIRQYFN